VFIAVTGDGIREVRKLFWPADRELVRTLSAFSSLHLVFKILSRTNP
jgi:hypothetical protein